MRIKTLIIPFLISLLSAQLISEGWCACDQVENPEQIPYARWRDISNFNVYFQDTPEIGTSNEKYLSKMRRLIDEYHASSKRAFLDVMTREDAATKISKLLEIRKIANKLVEGLSKTNPALNPGLGILNSDLNRKIAYLDELLGIPNKVESYIELRKAHAAPDPIVSAALTVNQSVQKNLNETPTDCGIDTDSTALKQNKDPILKIPAEVIDHVDPGFRDTRCLKELKEFYLKVLSRDKPQAPKESIFTPTSTNPEAAQRIQEFYLWLEKFDYPFPDLGVPASDWTRNIPEKNGLAAKMVTNILISCASRSTPYSKASRKVNFDDGTACHSIFFEPDKNKHRIRDGEYIYVIDLQGDLYVREVASGFHPTITRDLEIKCAGHIHFKRGKITKIDNKSGHYAPTGENLKDAVNILISKHGNAIFRQGAVIQDVASTARN
jgi:hypothetical protein